MVDLGLDVSWKARSVRKAKARATQASKNAEKDLQAQAHQPQGQYVKVTNLGTGKGCDGYHGVFQKPKQANIATK